MYSFLLKQRSVVTLRFFLLLFISAAGFSRVAAQSTTLTPVSDAYVRNGTYASANFGNDTSIVVKSSNSSGYTRTSYLKFSLSGVSNVGSAKLRIYGKNVDNTTSTTISAYSVTDSWAENTITFNNAPAANSSALSSTSVTGEGKYYEFDVTGYVNAESAGDKVVSFLIKDPSTQNRNLNFNSSENAKNGPQLVISTSTTTASNAHMFIENLDKVPSNDHFVFARIQVPWSRDGQNFNANHDSLTVRIHNKGISNLVVKSLTLSNTSTWKFVKLKGVDYNAGTSLPLTVGSGSFADLTVKFVAVDAATKIKVLHDTLTIVSNDDVSTTKAIYFDGLWQRKGEGSNEPSAQDIIRTFGYKTNTGYGLDDPDKGDSTKLKGDEIKPSYFVRADASLPVSVTQLAAYHGCCTSGEKISWYPRGKDSLASIFTHIAKDGQTLMPRKGTPSIGAAGTINPATAFGFNISRTNWTDARKNTGGKKAFLVWKARDPLGNIIPNTYILGNDYLGTAFTNYDYNDNMYLVTNVKPERGSAFFSALRATPSAVDFGEKLLQTTNSFQLNLASLGKTYSDGSKDPALTISSVKVVGENATEFSASMPVKTTLNAQETTMLTVGFKPASQGLKIADLLIYYNNSPSPLRVPLYAIAKVSGTIVTANYRVNSGSTSSLTINGKTWSADKYSFDNLEPYSNSKVTQIACTDEDALYTREQSSNADKAPFRYEFPVANGAYVVRLHFAELYWGAPGTGLNGGAGSRVMSVAVENQPKLVNLDVFNQVSGASALVKNIPVNVTDGKLNINFSASVNRPMVVAVEVYSFRASSARPADIVTAEDNTIGLYPNPVEKTLNLKFPREYVGDANLQIVDAVGKTYNLQKVSLQAGGANKEINISNLSLKPGFYYLRIVSATRTDIIKFIAR